MDMYSPAVAEAFELLQTDLYRHLEEAEFLAEQQWSEEQVELAHKLLPELVTVIRGVLITHKASKTGECRTCGAEWPCQVVTIIHRLVKDPDHHFVALVRQRESA